MKEVYVSINDSGGGPRELPDTGYQNAICAFVEDIGISEVSWQGEVKLQRKVIICWELAQLMADCRPFMLSNRYTMSLSEKANLRKDLEVWRGRKFTADELQKFNLGGLEGVGCTVLVGRYIGKDGNERACIDSIGPKMKGAESLAVFNEKAPDWIEAARQENRADEARRMAQAGQPPEAQLPVELAGGELEEVPF